ncbi:hypothetical protein WUBG_09614 [Wuchereria bancrofti]|uniref:Uncharacterized protein n=1 Tax=Wuchereria bancrofti TaxID=6293 RepID=J9EQY0_WUCBA|nr:hypothetical protein WUBG_09614 [Wuchereria bancrofti]
MKMFLSTAINSNEKNGSNILYGGDLVLPQLRGSSAALFESFRGIRQHGFWVLEEKIVKDHSQYSIKHAVDLKPPMISISSTSQDRTIFPSFIQPIWFYSVAMTLKFGCLLQLEVLEMKANFLVI